MTLIELIQITSKRKGEIVVKLLNSYADGENNKTIEVSYQNIPFEHEDSCHILELRDISHLQKL